eukprot:15467384-Alexandrium_andersonii.AAC.1
MRNIHEEQSRHAAQPCPRAMPCRISRALLPHAYVAPPRSRARCTPLAQRHGNGEQQKHPETSLRPQKFTVDLRYHYIDFNGFQRLGHWCTISVECSPNPEADQHGQSLPQRVELGVPGLGLEPVQVFRMELVEPVGEEPGG